MAFGKIEMVSRRAKPGKPVADKKVPEVKKQPVVYNKGASVMEVLLIAPSCEEAEDFLCGCYFNLNQMVGGSDLTVYTKEFYTITKLTDTKQLLEETILKPVGRELLRKAAEDEQPLSNCTITLGQAGNPALALDIHFTWAAPSAAGAQQADVVFALLNCAEPQSAQICVNAARNAAAGHPLLWIVSNFEQKKLFWSVDESSAPQAQLRRELKELLNLACAAGEYAVYTQVYGGMEFIGRTGGSALLRSDRRCREYMPMGCQVPVFVAMDAVRRYRTNQGENALPDAVLEKIWMLALRYNDTIKGWFDCHGEKGADGK